MTETIAGKYEVIEVVGRGGMGVVYKAYQKNLDRIVAVKMLSEELAADVEFRARFQQEATLVARLHHPNIVQVYDIEPHAQTFCIIMEYLEGESLQDKINRNIPLGERDIATWGAQIARALHHAHDNGIIHRDVKPDNIRITPDNTAKIMDFGIARCADSKLKTQTGISMGTPRFMSPEQVTGKNIDHQTDIYSLGICLYYCLSGRPPFDGPNPIAIATRHLYEQPEPPSLYNTSITPAMERVVMKAMEKTKANRFGTGEEMAEALMQTLGRAPIVLEKGADSSGPFDATRRMAASSFDPTEESYTPVTETAIPAHTPSGLIRLRDAVIAEMEPQRPISLVESTEAALASIPPHERRMTHRLGIVSGVVLVLVVGAGIWMTVSNSREKVEPPPPPTNGAAEVKTPPSAYEALVAGTSALVAKKEFRSAQAMATKFAETPDNGKYAAQVAGLMRDIERTWARQADKKILVERRAQKGNNYNGLGRYALAYVYFKSVHRLAPADATGSVYLGWLEKQIKPGDTAGAAKAAHLSKQAQDKTAGNQQSVEAEKDLLEAVSLLPSDPALWLQLAKYYDDAGFVDDARVLYEYTVSVAPAESEIRKKATEALGALQQMK